MISLLMTLRSIVTVAEIIANPKIEKCLSAFRFTQELIALKLIRADCDPDTGPPDRIGYLLIHRSSFMGTTR